MLIPSFILEERVLVADVYQLPVTVAPLVGNARQVRVPLLAVFAHDLRENIEK